MPPGAPSKYNSKYCEYIIEHFNIEPFIETPKGKEAPELPTMAGFAVSISVDMDTLTEWKKVHYEFSLAYKKAKAMQENIVVQNAMLGRYEKAFSIFLMKNCHNWTDKKEVEQTNRTINVVHDPRKKNDAD